MRLADVVIEWHRRYCRQWAVRLAWVVFVVTALWEVLLVAFAR
jgi:hypothetical protein